MANAIPNAFKGRLLGDDGTVSTAINLKTDTIKAAFLNDTLTPSEDNHTFFSHVSTYEVAASGSYSAGGITLTPTISTDNTDNEGVFDAADYSATTFTGTFRYICYYKSTGVASTSPVILIYDMGSNQTTTAGTMAVTVNAEGILNLITG